MDSHRLIASEISNRIPQTVVSAIAEANGFKIMIIPIIAVKIERTSIIIQLVPSIPLKFKATWNLITLSIIIQTPTKNGKKALMILGWKINNSPVIIEIIPCINSKLKIIKSSFVEK